MSRYPDVIKKIIIMNSRTQNIHRDMGMIKDWKKRVWGLCCAGVLILVALCFSPLVLSQGIYEPMFMGVPWTLWTSILIAVAVVILNLIGAFVHPGCEETEKEQKKSKVQS